MAETQDSLLARKDSSTPCSSSVMQLRSSPLCIGISIFSCLTGVSLLTFYIACRLYCPRLETLRGVTETASTDIAVEPHHLVNYLQQNDSFDKLTSWHQPVRVIRRKEDVSDVVVTGIPGSRIKNDSSVRSFRNRWNCVSQSGHWRYDPTPRLLHWPSPLSACDIRHAEIPGNLAGPHANNAALRDPEDWTVRESLKYVWDPSSEASTQGDDCGMWTQFSESKFCEALNGRKLLIAGDSLNGQFALSLILRMRIGEKVVPEGFFSAKCIQARAAYPHLSQICFSSPICESSGRPSHIFFVRSDYLDVPVALPGFSTENHWWVDEIAAQGVDVVVLNRGAHYVEDAAFEAQLNATLLHLRNRFPNLLTIVRSSSAGHADCMNFTRPIETRPSEDNLPHHWSEIPHQNRIAERLANSIGAAFLDVDRMTALRPDSHKGKTGKSESAAVDCLHYCIPGPQDGWSDMLFNMLLDLL